MWWTTFCAPSFDTIITICESASTTRLISAEKAEEIARVVSAYPFRRRDERHGPRGVMQRFFACEEEDIPFESPVRDLSRALEETLECVRNIFSTPLHFNDHLLLRYPIGMLGLGAHQDLSRYKNLIVCLTLAGHATFNVHEEPHEQPRISFPVGPGEAVFMAAPGLRGEECRPFHSVTNITRERIALVLKHKEV